LPERRTPGAPLQLLDIEAEEVGGSDDDDDNDNDLDEDEDEELTPASRNMRKGGNPKLAHPHCHINFVKDTNYYLLHEDTQKCWGTCTSEDPAPPPPRSRRDSCDAGDYLLIAGKDIKLKWTGGNYTKTTFQPEEELILTNDWHQFDQEMSGSVLFDLGDVTFLLWWQNIKAPPVPKKKAPTMTKKQKADAAKKKPRR
jgi:hypothetical protein